MRFIIHVSHFVCRISNLQNYQRLTSDDYFHSIQVKPLNALNGLHLTVFFYIQKGFMIHQNYPELRFSEIQKFSSKTNTVALYSKPW